MEDWKKGLIELLVRKKGLLFGEFKLKSGRISPYFFNLANVISDGEGLSKIAEAYGYGLQRMIGFENFDYIYGPAYKGIPLAAAIAQILYFKWGINKRWGYDRKEAKEYGVKQEKWLIGQLKDGDRIVIVDDVATTGKTKIDAVNKIKNYSGKRNLIFAGVLILLDRKEKSDEGTYSINTLREHGLRVYALLDAPEVFEYLKTTDVNGRKVIDNEQYRRFLEYHKKYGVEEG